jgi:hypothetical protein
MPLGTDTTFTSNTSTRIVVFTALFSSDLTIGTDIGPFVITALMNPRSTKPGIT